MSYKRIIPCLDISKGRLVKGVNFVSLKDAGDPVEIAIAYNNAGADELVLLDISASKEDRDITIGIIKEIVKNINIPFTVGGGINTIEDAEYIIKAGASKISVNSAAVKNPTLISDLVSKYGSKKVILAIDGKKKHLEEGWEVYINGGKKNTKKDLIEWAIEVERYGVSEILLTSMDCDGTKSGYDIELTHAVTSKLSIPVIASGGAGELSHFYDVANKGGASAMLAASLFHYRELEIREVKEYLIKKGIKVRI